MHNRMDRVSFLRIDTVCSARREPIPPILPMLPPRRKPKSSDYRPKPTRHGRAPRLQHLHILRWMSESPADAWLSTDDFLGRWAITKKHLSRIVAQLRSAFLIESVKNPRKRGNSRLYRITPKGVDVAEVGLNALQFAIYQGLKNV